MPFLTPNSLGGSTSALVTIPNDLLLKAAVVGALADLGNVFQWEEFGEQTPEDTANVMGAIVRSIEWGYVPPEGGILTQLHDVRCTFDVNNTDIITVPFDTVLSDPDAWWDSGSNSFIVPDDGVYLVVAQVAATSAVQLTLIANTDAGYMPLGGDSGNPGNANASGVAMLTLAAGDFVSLLCRTSGSTTLHPTTERAIKLQIALIG